MLTKYTEERIDTEETCPPTEPSPISEDSAYELASEAIDSRDWEKAKGWLQYMRTFKRFPI